MCRSASMVLTKDRIFWSKNSDSHEDILREHDLVPDGVSGPNVVRVEIYPAAYDYTLPLSKWMYRLDQDELPDWYNDNECEERARIELGRWAESKILLTGDHDPIDRHVVLIGGDAYVPTIEGQARVDRIAGNARVSGVHDQARINRVEGNAVIDQMYGTTVIEYLGGSVRIGGMSDWSRVHTAFDSAHIKEMRGCSMVQLAEDNVSMHHVYGNAQVCGLSGNARIDRLSDFARVIEAANDASIGEVHDYASVLAVRDRVQVGMVYSGFVHFQTDYFCKISGLAAVVLDSSTFTPSVHQGAKEIRTVGTRKEDNQ